MKLFEIAEDDSALRKQLDAIRFSIDHLNHYHRGEPILDDLSFIKELGGSEAQMKKDRQAQIEADIVAIRKGFMKSGITEKTLYVPIQRGQNVETPIRQYISATEEEIKTGYVMKVLPGANTLDFDKVIGSPDGNSHHLFKLSQRFKIVEAEGRIVTVRPIQF